jgi:hypothetical protein
MNDGFKYTKTYESPTGELVYKSVIGNINPHELGYSSGFNTLKVHKSGMISKAVGGSAYATVQVSHGLLYRPAFNAYYRDTLSGEVYHIMSGFEDIDFGRSGAEIAVHGASNNSEVTFTIFNNNASSRNVDIFYEIFYEDLSS